MADVARELGLPYTTYWGYEKGTREAGHDFIISVAKLYDVTSDYLLGLDDSENKSVEFYNNNDALLLANTYAKDPELMLLFKAAKNATPEGMKLAHDMLEALKRKEDGDDYEGIDEIRKFRGRCIHASLVFCPTKKAPQPKPGGMRRANTSIASSYISSVPTLRIKYVSL